MHADQNGQERSCCECPFRGDPQLAAEIKLSDCTAALVMPSSTVLHVASVGGTYVGDCRLSVSRRARSSSYASLLTILPCSNFESPPSLILQHSLSRSFTSRKANL